MLKKIKLTNWKSHLGTELEFGPGVNGLVGIMGAGKSSVMDAISFALYGTFPAHSGRRVKLDDLIMKRPQQKSSACIELEFTAEGRNYLVKRRLTLGKTAEAEIREEGRLIEVGQEKVTEWVERLLKMDYGLFSRAVYSEQNNIDYFLTLGRDERKRHIDNLLRLDRLEKARTGAVMLKNQMAVRADEKAKIWTRMEKECLSEKISDIENEISGLDVSITEISASLALAKEKRAAAAKRLFESERRRKQLAEAAASMERAAADIEWIDRQINEKEKCLNGMSGEKIRKEISKALDEEAGLSDALSAGREEVLRMMVKAAAANSRVNIIEDGIKNLCSLGPVCPVCESEITGQMKDALLSAKKAEKEKCINEAALLAEKTAAVNSSAGALEKALAEKRKEIARLEKAAVDAGGLEALRRKRDECSARLDRIEKEKVLIESECAADESALIRSEADESALLEGRLAAEISGKEQIRRRALAQLSDLKARHTEMERYARESRAAMENVKNILLFTEALSAAQNQLRDAFVSAVNSAMSAVWSELYPYGDYSEVRLAFENDYVLQLRHSGGWIPVEGIASGGERSLAALALRIAFSLAFIPNLRWLILDEPTHNLDSAAIAKFSEAMREKMAGFASQVFIITHEDRIIEGLGASQVSRLERDKAANGATVVAGFSNFIRNENNN
jgi:exonuclease SbcC